MEGVIMNFEDLRQLYGELYEFSDHKRGERITYRAYDGSIRSGEIIWVQPSGQTVSRDGSRKSFTAQYVVAPDIDTGMVDFVNLGDVQSE